MLDGVHLGPETRKISSSGWLALCLVFYSFINSGAGYSGQACQASRGDNTRYLPLDHPLYDYLDRLQERGRLKGLNPSLRPYTRLQVLEAVKSQQTENLKDFELEWLETVRKQAGLEPVEEAAGDSARMSVITRTEASYDFSNVRPERNRTAVGAGFGGKFSHFVFDSRFVRAPYLTEPGDTTSHRDPQTAAPFEEGLIRPMEGYLKGDFRLFGGAFSSEIFFGRLSRNWSPAMSQSLILGADAMSFDHLALTLRSRHLTFTHLVASLDGVSYRVSPESELVLARRFFTAHRLDIRIRDHLRFGITETTVYGGENRGFDLSLMNPFTSYRLVAIQNKRDHANNTFIALDCYSNIGDRLNLYGQFLFDDFLRDSSIQDRWAFDTGAVWRDLPYLGPTTVGLRATVVSSFAYNTFQPFERYLLDGRPLGAPLGNDYWSVHAFLRYFLSSRLDLKAQVTRIARGKQRIASPAQALLGSGDLDFPTPPVECRTEVGLAVRWQPLAWIHLVAEGGLLKQRNMNNHPGEYHRRGYAHFFLSLYHDYIISF
ncbi:MAG TPA: capsule assembly Wzi family protein [archaeon]|nr:capsule assembly Wzi family protein [archaeon]